MSVTLTQDRAALASLCRALEGAPFVALDTEFMRTRTFYARLCLIQVAVPNRVACVDPLALVAEARRDDKDAMRMALAPLLDVVYAPGVLKVLHSARQDLEVLADLCGTPPAPLFDTQVAAALLGHDDQVGYSTLVESLTGVRLEKLHTRTDWAARPLTPEQLAYAADDVRYLCRLYPLLSERLAARGRLGWLAEELEPLTDPGLFRCEPETAYRRIAAGQMLPAAAQPILAALAAWRERAARAQDLPRSWVLKDVVLVELARQAPRTRQALEAIEGMNAGVVRRWSREILAAIESGVSNPRRLWEAPVRLDGDQQTLCKRLADRVKHIAAEQQIAPALLATRQELQRLVLGRPSALLRGWRHKVAGEELERMCHASRPPATAVVAD